MKEIILSEEVTTKIKSLMTELHQLCVAHELPFVAATLLSRKQEGEDFQTERVASAYINRKTGATEPTILSAVKRLKEEPRENPIAKLILGALITAASDTECDCPKCRERRAEGE